MAARCFAPQPEAWHGGQSEAPTSTIPRTRLLPLTPHHGRSLRWSPPFLLMSEEFRPSLNPRLCRYQLFSRTPVASDTFFGAVHSVIKTPLFDFFKWCYKSLQLMSSLYRRGLLIQRIFKKFSYLDQISFFFCYIYSHQKKRKKKRQETFRFLPLPYD